MKTVHLGRERRNGLKGYLYLAPWLIGVVFFFAYSIIMTARYSFQTVDKTTFVFSDVGFANYLYAFRGDADFPRLLAESMLSMLASTPTVLIFAFFVAMLLRKEFKGNFIIKAIFFLTVILSSDVFLRLQNDTGSLTAAQSGAVVADGGQFFSAMDSFDLSAYFSDFNIGSGFFNFINSAIQELSQIMLKSGIPIFIFLAGLYSVPDSMYEAANVEGAGVWVSFWKITLPLMMPVLRVNLVYIIVDSFTSYLNETLNYIYTQGIRNFNIGYASALSWIYFLTVAIFLGIALLIVTRRDFGGAAT